MKYLLLLLLTSCTSKLVMQKAIYQKGKIVPIEKAVAFRMNENDTFNIVKKLR